jgi:hypothetical protein
MLDNWRSTERGAQPSKMDYALPGRDGGGDRGSDPERQLFLQIGYDLGVHPDRRYVSANFFPRGDLLL